MSEEEGALEIVHRILNVELPKALRLIMTDKKLPVEQKTKLMAQLDSVLTCLRLVRAGLET